MGRFKSNVLAQRPWHRPPRDSLDQDGRLSGSLAAFKFAISAGFEKNNIRDSFRKAFARRPILLFQKMRGWLRRHGIDRCEIMVEVTLQRDIEALILCTGTVIGKV